MGMVNQPRLFSLAGLITPTPAFPRVHGKGLAAEPKRVALSHITPVTEPRLESIKGVIRDQGHSGEIKAAGGLSVYNFGARRERAL